MKNLVLKKLSHIARQLRRPSQSQCGTRACLLSRLPAELAPLTTAQEIAEKTASILAQNFGDWCVIDIPRTDRELRPVAIAHRNPELNLLLQPLVKMRRAANSVCEKVFRSKQPIFMQSAGPEYFRHFHSDLPALQLMHKAGMRSFIVVPLVASGESVGVLTLFSKEFRRPLTRSSIHFLEEVGRRVGQAVDSVLKTGRAGEFQPRHPQGLMFLVHELKNPLSAASLCADLLNSLPGLPAESRPILNTMIESLKRVESMTAELHELERIEAGTYVWKLEISPIRGIIDDVLDVMSPLAKHAGVTLSASQVQPDLRLRCDKRRISQVLTNLVANSLRHTSAGGSVTLTCATTIEGLRFQVKDTGSGILPEHLPHVFERYWRGNHHCAKGAGLGLWIAKRIVEGHHGRIWLESSPGAGTSAFVVIPGAADVSDF